MQQAGGVTITRLGAHPAKQEAVTEPDQHFTNHCHPVTLSQRIHHISHVPHGEQQGGVENQSAWTPLDSRKAISQIAPENQFLIKGSDHAAIQRNAHGRQPLREIGRGE